MYPGHHAKTSPDKPAAISATTGEVVTYAELDARSNRLAQLLWSEGLRRGDHIAVFLETHLRYFEVAWAADRSRARFTRWRRNSPTTRRVAGASWWSTARPMALQIASRATRRPPTNTRRSPSKRSRSAS